jgi:DNA polymerase III epsilon subunit-like protein
MSGSTQEDKVISLAIGEIIGGELVNLQTGLFNPGVPIKQGASWVHKFTDSDLVNQPCLKDTTFYSFLNSVFSSNKNVVIGHAVCNDLTMIARDGIYCKCLVIDTQFCSQKILKTEKTSLNFLTKEFNLINSEDIKFHTAEGDVIATYHLLKELLKTHSLRQLIEISMAPIYEFSVSGEGYRNQKIYHLAARDKEILLSHFGSTKDQKAFYALMYFYGNAHIFKGETKKKVIMRLLS